jgi:hypothetical protein
VVERQCRRLHLHNSWIVCFCTASHLGDPYDSAIIELEESLSGSASSDEDGDESDAISNLVSKANRLAPRSPSPELTSKKHPASPLTWFHSPPSTQFGFYKAVLPLEIEETSYLNELRNMQIPVPSGRKWAMFMVAGGHFAGAIVRVSRDADEVEEIQHGRKAKQKKPKPDTEVLLHKTFHRYTSEFSALSCLSHLNIRSTEEAGWFPIYE